MHQKTIPKRYEDHSGHQFKWMENKKINQRVRQHLLLLQNVTMGVQRKLWLHHIEQGNKRKPKLPPQLVAWTQFHNFSKCFCLKPSLLYLNLTNIFYMAIHVKSYINLYIWWNTMTDNAEWINTWETLIESRYNIFIHHFYPEA